MMNNPLQAEVHLFSVVCVVMDTKYTYTTVYPPFFAQYSWVHIFLM